jgi:excisionase family DNA binding protein
MEKPQELLSMPEIIAYAKIGRAAVYTAIKKGRLTAIKVRGHYKVSRSEIDRYRLSKYNRDEREINGRKLFCVEEGTFSVHQVAKIVSNELKIAYSMQRVYHLIRTGQLRASRVGRTFVVMRDDLIALIEKEKGVKFEDYRQFKFGKTA